MIFNSLKCKVNEMPKLWVGWNMPSSPSSGPLHMLFLSCSYTLLPTPHLVNNYSSFRSQALCSLSDPQKNQIPLQCALIRSRAICKYIFVITWLMSDSSNKLWISIRTGTRYVSLFILFPDPVTVVSHWIKARSFTGYIKLLLSRR